MMLINARPRIVSNRLEAFVPTQKPEFHQGLIEMANSEVNAWSLFRSVAASTDEWDQNFDDFNARNFPSHPFYAGYYHDIASTHQAGATNFPRASFAEEYHSRSPLYARPTMLQQTYDRPAPEVDCIENPNPMLAVDYSQWNLRRRQGSFAECSNVQNGVKNSYHSSNDVTPASFVSTKPLAQPQSPYQSLSGSSTDGVPKTDKTSPSTVYSSYSSSNNTSLEPQSLSYLASNPRETLARSSWWPEHSQDSKDQSQYAYGMATPADGLPGMYGVQHVWNNTWNIPGASTSHWVATQAVPATVSPKALALNVSPSVSSSPRSSQGRALSLSDSNTDSSSGDDDSQFSGPETFAVVEESQSIRQTHQPSLDTVPRFQQNVPVVPSNGPPRDSRKRLLRQRSGYDDEEYEDPSTSSASNATSPPLNRPPPASLRLLVPKPADPRTALPHVPQLLNRNAKDDFLIRSKLAGMSYKEIRRQGNFTEAESTLRGRFRTLTKHRDARVRKPEWCDNDIRLLKKAVRKLAKGPDPSRCRVPWKKVAEYIAHNGGSYHFGNATCRKRWDELQQDGS